MGGGGVGSTRSEFIPEETIADDRYHRNAGFFVTTKRAFGFILLAFAFVIVIVLLMYYFGPKREISVSVVEDVTDIEELINKTMTEELSTNSKLSADLQPIFYRLKIHPILDEWSPRNFTYTAQVQIFLQCNNPTDRIEIHWDGGEVTSENVALSTSQRVILASNIQASIYNDSSTSVDNTTIFPMDYANDLSNETQDDVLIGAQKEAVVIEEIQREMNYSKLILKLESYLVANQNYTLDIRVDGKITNNLVGFYRISYRDESQNVRWLATTNFHPTYARRVFPCFDDPFFKSTFEISIARRTNMTALSNMPLRETEEILDGNETVGWVWDHFFRSPLMSSHLVSFIICDLENTRTEPTDIGPIINIWAPASELNKTKFALHSAHAILPFLETYLHLKYPLTKIDLLAIPNYVEEKTSCWGIISFRKSSILLHENSKNWKVRQQIFTTIAMALAQQWFGNLVTMKSWSDLWLNEGIGSFLAEAAQNTLKPNWETANDFAYRVMYKSFSADTLKSTYSIQTDLTQNLQIEHASNAIIQSKATSLIRMLNYTLSEQIFKQGLRRYLKTLAYQTTEQNTLWDLLTNISKDHNALPENLTVTLFMDSWIKQKGYPYITVTRNYETGETVITQQIFIQDNVNNESIWYIPLRYSSVDQRVKTAWMLKERTITLKLNVHDWTVFNVGQTGYYRVQYDNINWNLLEQQLRKGPNGIPTPSRAQLLDDAYELAQMGILQYDTPLQITKYLRHKETNYVPWIAALNSLEEIWFITSNYEYTEVFEHFMLNLIIPHLIILRYKDSENEPQNNKIIRARLIQIACQVRYELALNWSHEHFQDWMNAEDLDAVNPLPYGYQVIIMCTSVRVGGWKEWEFLWNRTRASNVSSEELSNMYLGLGCSHDPWLINKYLDLSLNGNISIEHIPYVWKSINHPVGIRTGLHFLRLNWNRIYNTYKDVNVVLTSICQEFLSRLSTEIDLQDLTKFFQSNQENLKPVATLIQSAVDAIKMRISWKEKYLDFVVDWLRNNSEDYVSLYSLI